LPAAAPLSTTRVERGASVDDIAPRANNHRVFRIQQRRHIICVYSIRATTLSSSKENSMTRDNRAVTETGGRNADANRDPISGEPGAHPVGTGVGAAAAGAAAGAAGGLIAGPAGAAVGAVIGAVAGGLAGKGVAESIDPTVEDTYWRQNYAQRPYYDKNTAYEDYRPAYQLGWEARSKYASRSFDEAEPELGRDWEAAKRQSQLTWDKARHATRDAWNRVEHSVADDRSGNR
jgi:hypothetical protein